MCAGSSRASVRCADGVRGEDGVRRTGDVHDPTGAVACRCGANGYDAVRQLVAAGNSELAARARRLGRAVPAPVARLLVALLLVARATGGALEAVEALRPRNPRRAGRTGLVPVERDVLAATLAGARIDHVDAALALLHAPVHCPVGVRNRRHRDPGSQESCRDADQGCNAGPRELSLHRPSPPLTFFSPRRYDGSGRDERGETLRLPDRDAPPRPGGR